MAFQIVLVALENAFFTGLDLRTSMRIGTGTGNGVMIMTKCLSG
jgi:hypothetical protein